MYISLREKLTNKQCTDFSQHPVSWRGDFFHLPCPERTVVICGHACDSNGRKRTNIQTYQCFYIYIYISIYLFYHPTRLFRRHLFRRCQTASPWESWQSQGAPRRSSDSSDSQAKRRRLLRWLSCRKTTWEWSWNNERRWFRPFKSLKASYLHIFRTYSE